MEPMVRTITFLAARLSDMGGVTIAQRRSVMILLRSERRTGATARSTGSVQARAIGEERMAGSLSLVGRRADEVSEPRFPDFW
jgi:hypothetical protein